MSSSELRRRANAGAAARTTSMTMDSTIPPFDDYDESNLSARALLSASPVHSSFVYKMHIPVIYSLLPYTVRWILHRCFPRSWSPRWKRRRLIALGSYIYKFEEFDNDDSNGGKLPPKGVPIPVPTADVRLVSNLGGGNDDDDVVFFCDSSPEDKGGGERRTTTLTGENSEINLFISLDVFSRNRITFLNSPLIRERQEPQLCAEYLNRCAETPPE